MNVYTRSCPVPNFLDNDQQRLYHQALYVYRCLFGGDASEVCIGDEDKFLDMVVADRSGDPGSHQMEMRLSYCIIR